MRILILFAIISLTACRSTSASDDRVTELDGYYNFSNDFEIYSGYLVLQDDPLINIHYVFVTSMRSPKDDDVVLWLNGGPGCSSLLGTLYPK